MEPATKGSPAREANPEEGGNWFAAGRGPATATEPAGRERHWRERRGAPGSGRPGNRGGGECAMSGHPDGEAERFHETPRARRPLSRDVERGPMIHRRPNNRQAHGHIDRPIETPELDRDMPLVVIHRHDEIEFPFEHPVKEGVGG